MSRLAELIEELCPDGVEYRPLGELLSYQQPTPFLVSSKDYDPSYPTPVLTAGAAFLLGYSSETHGVYAASTDDPVIIFDDFTTASKWVDFPFKLKSSAAKILTAADPSVADIRILYFLMQTIKYQVGSHARQWIAVYSKMPVCCPPIEVQREIVRILDQFTTLEAELEAELEARRAQYEHYRNHLLSYDSLAACGPVDMVELGSVVTLLDSRRIPLKKGDRVSGEYPYYGASGIVDYVDSYIFDEDLLLVSEDGANLKARTKPIAFSASGRVWVNNHAHVLKVESSFYQKFLEEYLNSLDLEPYLVGSTQPKLNQSGLLSIPVPLPTEQALERSVFLLEKLKLFVTDFSAGLPAEIAARRAQYEHYRDRLLSFPEKVVSVSDAS